MIETRFAFTEVEDGTIRCEIAADDKPAANGEYVPRIRFLVYLTIDETLQAGIAALRAAAKAKLVAGIAAIGT